MAREKGLSEKVGHDSAGTGNWHAGEPPDARMIAHAKERGYDLRDLRARSFNPEKDFQNFDLILTMDDSNFMNVCSFATAKEHLEKVKRMTSYCKIHDVDVVPDPYHQGFDGFELVLDILEDACEQLLQEIKAKV